MEPAGCYTSGMDGRTLLLLASVSVPWSVGCGGPLPGDDYGAAALEEIGIINGEPITSDEWPAMAQVIVQGTMQGMPVTMPMCTSTLIAPDVMLSAGHCIDEAATGITISAVCFTFEADTTYMSDPQYNYDPPLPDDAVCSSGMVQHPQFDIMAIPPTEGLSNWYDLSLIFLESSITDRPHSYVPTAEEGQQLVEQMEVDIAGYGMRHATDSSQVNLRYWAHTFINELGEFEMQVGSDASTGRKCHGDSGGPTFVDVETELTEAERVIGVTSRAYTAAVDCGAGGIDMRVDAFYDWIEEEFIAACDAGLRFECEDPGIPRPPEPEPEPEPEENGPLGGPGASGCGADSPFSYDNSWVLSILALLVVIRRRG